VFTGAFADAFASRVERSASWSKLTALGDDPLRICDPSPRRLAASPAHSRGANG
jgi:hypothetical protein